MFTLDKRLENSSYKVIDWGLSEVRLRDNQHYPWLILIPRVTANVTEIFQLAEREQEMLISEMTRLSQLMKTHFNAEKINVGALGNIVSQLHIHVIARFQHDLSWPHSVWQADVAEKSYAEKERNQLIQTLRDLLS